MSVPLIESVHFQNFKALRDTTLPLGRFTLIVGANGSGKSTAMQALETLMQGRNVDLGQTISSDLRDSPFEVRIEIKLLTGKVSRVMKIAWQSPSGVLVGDREFPSELKQFKTFSFDPNLIFNSVVMQPGIELAQDGSNLAGVLENLRDGEPERFESLNKELNRWLPEFDRILFETPSQGKKAFLLRTTAGKHPIRAANLSQGTLLALAYLTMAYLPNPPGIVCFEEPEHGVHPRLLRRIQDAMYRLAYPESFGETRNPVQVIATTHSPYLLDLYKDHPEEIVIASKEGDNVKFERLSDKPHIQEVLDGAPLGDIWYSGVLGGVPAGT
jgi:predicted ATPase